jgi:glutamine cyclotransferase
MARHRNRSTAPAAAAPSAERQPWRLFAWAAVLLVAGIGGLAVWNMWAEAQDRRAADYGYEVVNVFPHDADAFTQGLICEKGVLYEGTGHEGRSTLRKVELDSGRVVESRSLGTRLFGEGIAIVGDSIYQLTWKNGVCLLYDKATLRQTDVLRYSGEGWGLTYDGTHLVMSNGTSTLQFLDPKTLRVVRKVNVAYGGSPVDKLNELEYIDGEIFANIWYSDYIARISPETGEVTAWIDMSGLLRRFDREHVLNGIAYDKESKRLFVTGKNWPKLFEVRIVPKK